MKIKEIIVVEGKDDITAVKRAVDATVIATHGFGFGEKLLKELKVAQQRQGLIIFTDPDYMGKEIRKRIQKVIPEAKHAYLPREEAVAGDDVGIENATPESIIEALTHARATVTDREETFGLEDMRRWGLRDHEEAQERRQVVARKLHLGHGNAKQFLKKLNGYGISREEVEAVIHSLDEEIEEKKTQRKGNLCNRN